MFAALLVVAMLSFVDASNVQVFHITAGNSDYAALPLNVGQLVSGSFSVTGVANDQQIAFWVTNPRGTRIIDFGLVSGGAEFNFTADEEGICSVQFFNFPSLSYSEETVTLTHDVTTPEVSGPDYLFYSVLTAIVLALALTFIFIAYDRRKSGQSVKEFKRAPMVRESDIRGAPDCSGKAKSWAQEVAKALSKWNPDIRHAMLQILECRDMVFLI